MHGLFYDKKVQLFFQAYTLRTLKHNMIVQKNLSISDAISFKLPIHNNASPRIETGSKQKQIPIRINVIIALSGWSGRIPVGRPLSDLIYQLHHHWTFDFQWSNTSWLAFRLEEERQKALNLLPTLKLHHY